MTPQLLESTGREADRRRLRPRRRDLRGLPRWGPDLARTPIGPRRAAHLQRRHRRRLGLVLTMLGITVTGLAGLRLWAQEAPVPTAEEVAVVEAFGPGPNETADPAPAAPEPTPLDPVVADPPAVVPPAPPGRLVIEAIDVDHPIIPVGLLPDGGMEVPGDVDEIGWYEPGVAPGAQGSAVLAGHVDSRTQGAGAFYDLRLLQAGDVITVTDEAGIERSWEVTHLVRYPKDELPVEDIFRWRGEAADLVLITCGGDFDRTARSYEDNIVVYASPM